MISLTSFTISPAKIAAGFVGGALSVFCNDLLPLFISVVVFESIDFVTGVIKSKVVANRKGEKFAFESVKAWRTIYKFVFILIGIMMAEMLDNIISDESRFRFANYFTAFCCGVEFWSFLENAAVISDHPIFRWLRKFMKVKIEDKIGTDFDEIKKDKENE